MEKVTLSGSWWLPLILAAISLIVSSFVGYNRNDKDLASRVSVLEAHQEDSVSHLNRIETILGGVDNKLDSLTKDVYQALAERGPVRSYALPAKAGPAYPPPLIPHTAEGEVQGLTR